MEPSAYIKKVLKKNNLTLKELSKKTGVNYQTLRNLTCNKTNSLSPKIASKIGFLDNRKDYEVMYEYFSDNAYKYKLTENELLYVSRLYCTGYSIEFNYSCISPLTDDMKSYLVAKEIRSGSKFTVVEDLSKLKSDYLSTIFHDNICAKLKSYDELFRTSKSYFSSVLYYGISKVQSISKDSVINYVLLFSDTEDLEIVKPLLPYKSSVKIHLIHETIPDELRFVNLLREELNKKTSD